MAPFHRIQRASWRRFSSRFSIIRPKPIQATHTSIQRLKDFKQWLGSRGLRRAFRTKQEFKLEVERALKAWRSRQVDEATGPKAREPAPTFIPSA
jgi:hypothetical protein